MDKKERCIQHIKEKNVKRGCRTPEGNGTKRCPNSFAICAHSVPKAKVADRELEEAAEALKHVQVINL